jgi:hypothetical protein
VTGADRVSEAVAELYSSDPDAFTERRGDLAARARAAGEASAAKAIAGLRKPTRSAWAVNQVVRADPSVPSRLAALGDELRAAEAALDGATIRELSVARRQLIDALVAQALAASGQHPPSAALREEVTATFAAALADPQLIAQMAAGPLVRVERRAGVGSGAVPVLSVAPSPAARRPAPATEAAAPAKSPAQAAAVTPGAEAPTSGAEAATAKSISRSTAEAPAARVAARSGAEAAADRSISKAAAEAAAARVAARSAARAAAAAAARTEAERERRQAIAEAERAVADADRAAFSAAQAEQEQDSAVRLVEEQLAEASQRLSQARRQRREAESAQRKARQALGRLTR